MDIYEIRIGIVSPRIFQQNQGAPPGKLIKNNKFDLLIFTILLIMIGNTGIVSADNEETSDGSMNLFKCPPFTIQYPSIFGEMNAIDVGGGHTICFCCTGGETTCGIYKISFYINTWTVDLLTRMYNSGNDEHYEIKNSQGITGVVHRSFTSSWSESFEKELYVKDENSNRYLTVTFFILPTSELEQNNDFVSQSFETRYHNNVVEIVEILVQKDRGAELLERCRVFADCLALWEPVIDYSFSTFLVDSSVTSLTIQPEQAILDENPTWAGGGKRIYPDRSTPDDTTNRKKIKVVATTSLPNSDVYFKSFDMNDPTSDDINVDPNGPLGDDNRGDPKEGTLREQKVTSNNQGIAETWFEVTMHPGDNFRIAASCDPDYLDGISVEGTELKDGEGNILTENKPTKNGRSTPLITVWRRLHIEVDSMGPVKGNQVKGTIDTVNPQNNQGMTEIALKGTNPKYLNTNKSEHGALYIEGHEDYYEVISNTDTTISVKGSVPTAAKGKSFILVDDDNFKGDGTRTGDEGVDVAARPDTFSLLQKSDDPSKNVLAPAFIMPLIDGGGDSNNNNGFLPFVLNTVVDIANVKKIINNGLSSAGNERDDYWVAYFLIAYQPEYFNDNDPDLGKKRSGAANPGVTSVSELKDFVKDETEVPSGGQGSIIFIETMRDLDTDWGTNDLINTAPHELGHQMGLKGDNKQFGLMSQPERGHSDKLVFVPQHLNILRWRVKSPGM